MASELLKFSCDYDFKFHVNEDDFRDKLLIDETNGLRRKPRSQTLQPRRQRSVRTRRPTLHAWNYVGAMVPAMEVSIYLQSRWMVGLFISFFFVETCLGPDGISLKPQATHL